MIINDLVYGREEISEQVILDLIKSPTLQRLKGISQFGLPQEYYYMPVYSRFEHSAGVLILLRRLNADLEEQIAGLLHDISHTAFSHVVDWVIGNISKEDYQDKRFLNFLKNSDISKILKSYGFEYKKISNPHNFSLLEKEIPSICADRIDYSLREILVWDKNIVNEVLNDLINFNGQAAFKSKKIAEKFALGFLKCQKEHWAGDEARARYYLFSKILKEAIQKGIIDFKDLDRDDAFVITKLKNGKDKEILNHLGRLKGKFILREYWNGIILNKKFRYVNPEVIFNGDIKKLSEISEGFEKILKTEKENSNLFKRVIIEDEHK